MTEILIRTAEEDELPPEDEGLTAVPFQTTETEGAIELRAQVPGFEGEDIELVLDGDRLIVSGFHEDVDDDEEEIEEDQELEAEDFLGFVQAFSLPIAVTPSQVEAELDDAGVLTIVIDKNPEVAMSP